MNIHVVISNEAELYQKPFIESFSNCQMIINFPTIDFDPSTMSGLEWIDKLKSNNLTESERKYVSEMMEIAKKTDALAIPAGGWSGLSSQDYPRHRNDTVLHIAKPEKLTSQELCDLTAIYCHKQLGHAIVGECHGLHAYIAYMQLDNIKLDVFDADLVLENLECKDMRLYYGVFTQRPHEAIDQGDQGYHPDFAHNTFAYKVKNGSTLDNLNFGEIKLDHPLQSSKFTWIAKPGYDGKINGFHVINGLNHWIKKYLDSFTVAFGEQKSIYGIGLYLNREDDSTTAYDSDGERGNKQTYRSSLSKKNDKSSWATMDVKAKDCFDRYRGIIASVSLYTGKSTAELEADFQKTIFKHIADAYIEKLPGEIITSIKCGYGDTLLHLTQHHPSKSDNLQGAQLEIDQRNALIARSVNEEDSILNANTEEPGDSETNCSSLGLFYMKEGEASEQKEPEFSFTR
ncbi:hypothetical protein L3V82_13060 [Thiotrichales bacterium 19S3-7]|nr:hypothetical protein [Thiotrichales bacterium 19S3-7]MCF6803100.1 hypothetical protein [Thiotrichales bacterium 19S3-11]